MIREYKIIKSEGIHLREATGSLFGDKEDLIALYKDYLIIPISDLPAGFSPESYTLENGKLVKASEELIASRQAASLAAYNEGQRALREAEYRASTDPRVLELIADADPAIAAMKADIRARYPYKE